MRKKEVTTVSQSDVCSNVLCSNCVKKAGHDRRRLVRDATGLTIVVDVGERCYNAREISTRILGDIKPF